MEINDKDTNKIKPYDNTRSLASFTPLDYDDIKPQVNKKENEKPKATEIPVPVPPIPPQPASAVSIPVAPSNCPGISPNQFAPKE